MIFQTKPCKYSLLTVIILLKLFSPAIIVNAEEQQDIWSDRTGRSPEMREEIIEEHLDRIAKENPERAEQLKQLRIDNPQEFIEEFRRTSHEMFRRRPGQGKPGQPLGKDRHRPDMMMPPRSQMGPPGSGPKDKTQMQTDGHSRRWKQRIQEKHEEYIEWLEKNYPQKAKALKQLREKNPEEYAKRVMAGRERYGEIMEADRKNPKLAKVLKEDVALKQNRDKLMKNISSATDEEKLELTGQLQEIIGKRFDIIIKKKQFRYEGLQKKLERLQKEVDHRQSELEKLKESKVKAVEDRAGELIGQTEKINWE